MPRAAWWRKGDWVAEVKSGVWRVRRCEVRDVEVGVGDGCMAMLVMGNVDEEFGWVSVVLV